MIQGEKTETSTKHMLALYFYLLVSLKHTMYISNTNYPCLAFPPFSWKELKHSTAALFLPNVHHKVTLTQCAKLSMNSTYKIMSLYASMEFWIMQLLYEGGSWIFGSGWGKKEYYIYSVRKTLDLFYRYIDFWFKARNCASIPSKKYTNKCSKCWVRSQ